VAELDSGAVKTIPWAEVRRRFAALMPQFAVEFHPLAATEAEAAERRYPNETRSRALVFSGSSIGRSI
jgi:hypothetical protein